MVNKFFMLQNIEKMIYGQQIFYVAKHWKDDIWLTNFYVAKHWKDGIWSTNFYMRHIF